MNVTLKLYSQHLFSHLYSNLLCYFCEIICLTCRENIKTTKKVVPLISHCSLGEMSKIRQRAELNSLIEVYETGNSTTVIPNDVLKGFKSPSNG